RIGDDRRSAVLASGAKVVQPFQVSALALPVADRVVDELKLRDVAEVGNREHRLEHGLQAAVLALARQLVHLEEAVVRTLLNLDQVRDLDGCWNFGKIKTLAEDAILCHSQKLPAFTQPGGCINNADRSGARGRQGTASGRSKRKIEAGASRDKTVPGRHTRRL